MVTYFKVGKVYKTRGGDEVRVTGIGNDHSEFQPIKGDFLSVVQWDLDTRSGSWDLQGYWYGETAPHAYDLCLELYISGYTPDFW